MYFLLQEKNGSDEGDEECSIHLREYSESRDDACEQKIFPGTVFKEPEQQPEYREHCECCECVIVDTGCSEDEPWKKGHDTSIEQEVSIAQEELAPDLEGEEEREDREKETQDLQCRCCLMERQKQICNFYPECATEIIERRLVRLPTHIPWRHRPMRKN